MITPKEAVETLTNLYQEKDLEYSHVKADSILCELLDQLGYEEVVEAFKKLPKWYA